MAIGGVDGRGARWAGVHGSEVARGMSGYLVGGAQGVSQPVG
jgi:hypothetical protein